LEILSQEGDEVKVRDVRRVGTALTNVPSCRKRKDFGKGKYLEKGGPPREARGKEEVRVGSSIIFRNAKELE